MNDKVWTHHAYLAAAYALTGRADAARKEIDVVEAFPPVRRLRNESRS